MKYLTIVVLLCALILSGFIATIGNTKSKKSQKISSGIQGEIVRIGFPPMNPDDCPDCPFPGTRILISDWAVVVRRASDGREVGRMKTNKDGKFKFVLPAGKYKIVADPNDMGGVPNREQEVIVKPNKLKYVYVVFDGGW